MTTIDTGAATAATGTGTTETSSSAVATGAAGTRGSTESGALAVASSWLTTTDHKRIGRLFIGSSLLAALAVAIVGVALGIERSLDDTEVFDPDAWPQMFVALRYGLVFGVGLPLTVGVAVAAVPLQIGARALAFARLALTGFWLWAIGLVFVAIALANNGGPGGGDADMVDLYLAANGLQLLGLVAAAMSVATTVLTARAPGMTMRRLPMFSWAALVQALGLLLSLPVQLGLAIYLFVDHRNDGLAFGGNTGIGQWTGYALTQPTTYLVGIPVFGLAAELLAVTFRRRLLMRGVLFGGIGLVGVAALGSVTQQATFALEWRGSNLSFDDFGATFEDLVSWGLFLGLPLLGALVVLAAGGLTAKRARPTLAAPFAFAFLGAAMVVTGMVGGLLYAITDLGLLGTVFEEGALVYVIYGSVLASLGAIAHWAPKWWGVRLGDKQLLGLAGLGFVATVLASLPYYAAGFFDQPAGTAKFEYGGPNELWNIAVVAGHALMFVTVAGFAGLLASQWRSRDAHVPDDPYRGHTLEWATASPAPTHNFSDVHTVSSPEPMLDLQAEPDDAATADEPDAETAAEERA